MRRLIKFFFAGPGVVLVIIGLILWVCWVIKQGQDKERAEAAKRQVQRQLGRVNPGEDVDRATAPKDVLLSDRKLNRMQANLTPTSSPGIAPTPIPQRPQSLSPLVSFYAQVTATPIPSPTAPAAEPPRPQSFLPPGTFIPCALVNTVESSHINTPVVGEVLRDMWQNGRLIVPAGAIVSSFAESGAIRDRIEVAGTWLITYPDGRHLRVRGIACDREADPANQQFGIEDGSAGLQGELVESDHWANAKAFIALLMTAAMQTGTAVATSTLQAAHTTGVTALPDTTPILAKYLDQLLNGETGDGRFVRVRASKEFYLWVMDTVLPANRVISEQAASPGSSSSDRDGAVQQAVELEKQILNASREQVPENANQPPRFHY
jgi:hypothetical protein